MSEAGEGFFLIKISAGGLIRDWAIGRLECRWVTFSNCYVQKKAFLYINMLKWKVIYEWGVVNCNNVPKFICNVLHDLVPFVQFKKREIPQWRSVTFCKVEGFQPPTLLKETLPHGYFSRFLNCTNGTKFHNASQCFSIGKLCSHSVYLYYPWNYLM